MSKKNLLLLIALLVLTTMTACNENKQDSFTQAQPTPIINESEITRCSASAKDGYYEINQYFDGGSSLTYWDYTNGKNVFLCPNPNCSHNSDTCPSFFSFLTNRTMPGGVLVVGDKLLAIQILATEKSDPHIDVMDLTGNLIKQIQCFQSSQILPGSFTSDYYTDGENLYFTLSNVDSDTATTVCQLVRVSLTDGSIAILIHLCFL